MARFPKQEANILALAASIDQPKQTELEYKIIAVNKAGTGLESNTIMAVL